MAQLLTTAVSLVGHHEPRLALHAPRISSFLDVSYRFSRDDALTRGSASLLQRVLTRELAKSGDPLVVHQWVWTTLQRVVGSSSLPLVHCLVAFIHPMRSRWDVVQWAIASGDLPTVQWLYAFAMELHGAHVNHDLLLREAVLRGDVDILRWLLDQRSPSASSPPTKMAKPMDLTMLAKRVATPANGPATPTAANDPAVTEANWAIVELLLERLGLLAHRSLPLLAAQQGRLATIQTMQAHGVSLGLAVANAAASKGHFEIVAWLGIPPTSGAMDDAAIDGSATILEKLRTTFQCELTAAGVLRAADNGHVNVLKHAWASDPENPFWTDFSGLLVPAFTAAVDAGHLAVVTWLYETHLEPLLSTKLEPNDRYIIKADSAYLALQRRQLPVIQYLTRHELLDWSSWEGTNAVYYCDLEALKWLHDQQLLGEPRNELSSAVYAGRLDCIQWILANLPLETATYAVEYAMLHGRMDVLELLLAETLPSSFRAIDFAASRGHLEAIQRLVAHRHDMDPPFEGEQASVAAIHSACLAGHLDVVQYLTDHPVRGATCTTVAMDSAASKGFLPLVEYLHKNRTEGCTVAAMDAAAANGDMAMVAFLHKNRSEGCSPAALEGAAAKGHFELVQFLITAHPQTYSPAIATRARAKGQLEIALWLEQWAAPVERRKSRSLITERVLPASTPIVG